MHFAGFGKRFAAYGYDTFLVAFLTWPIFYVLADCQWPQGMGVLEMSQAFNARVLLGEESADLEAAFACINMFGTYMTVMSAVYNVLFVLTRWQATPGKRFCGLKVVDCSGARIGFVRSLVRHAASGLSLLPLGLGFIMIAWTKQHAALHDKIAATRVVHAS